MSVINVTRMIDNGYKAYGAIDKYLNITRYISIFQAVLQHPIVIGFHVLKNFKHCYDVVPVTCKNWRDLFKLSQRLRNLTHSFGAEAELVKCRVLYKVVAVTGSFFCIVGALGQFFFVNSPRLYAVARVVDFIGLGLLLIEPCVGFVLQKKEREAEARHNLLEEESESGSGPSSPYSTNASQDPHLAEPPSEQRHVERENSYARMQLHNSISYSNLASYACYFVARAMHMVATCVFVNWNRKWVIVRTALETAGLVLSFISPARISYRWVCQQSKAYSKHINLVKRVLTCSVRLVERALPVWLAPQRLQAV